MGQLIKAMNDTAALFPSEITVFYLPDVESGTTEQSGAVPFHCSYMVGVLVRDENVVNIGRVQVQPAHLFFEPGIIVASVNHNGNTILGIEENVSYKFPDAAHALVNAARVQWLENFFSPINKGHEFFLKF